MALLLLFRVRRHRAAPFENNEGRAAFHLQTYVIQTSGISRQVSGQTVRLPPSLAVVAQRQRHRESRAAGLAPLDPLRAAKRANPLVHAEQAHPRGYAL